MEVDELFGCSCFHLQSWKYLSGRGNNRSSLISANNSGSKGHTISSLTRKVSQTHLRLHSGLIQEVQDDAELTFPWTKHHWKLWPKVASLLWIEMLHFLCAVLKYTCMYTVHWYWNISVEKKKKNSCALQVNLITQRSAILVIWLMKIWVIKIKHVKTSDSCDVISVLIIKRFEPCWQLNTKAELKIKVVWG